MSEELQTSKYNSGVNIIMRLDYIWRSVTECVILEKYYSWNTLLDRVWCELARDLSSDDYPKKKKEKDDFDSKLAKTGKLVDTLEGVGFNTASDDIIKNRTVQYSILIDKELFLRRLENTLGKGTAWEEGDEEDL